MEKGGYILEPLNVTGREVHFSDEDLKQFARCKKPEDVEAFLCPKPITGIPSDSVQWSNLTEIREPFFGYGRGNGNTRAGVSVLEMAGMFRDALELWRADKTATEPAELYGQLVSSDSDKRALIMGGFKKATALALMDEPIPPLFYKARVSFFNERPVHRAYVEFLEESLYRFGSAFQPFLAPLDDSACWLVIPADNLSEVVAWLVTVHLANVYSVFDSDGLVYQEASTPASQIWLRLAFKMSKAKVKRCAWCGVPYLSNERGQKGVYCSAKCRKAAFDHAPDKEKKKRDNPSPTGDELAGQKTAKGGEQNGE